MSLITLQQFKNTYLSHCALTGNSVSQEPYESLLRALDESFKTSQSRLNRSVSLMVL